jgi:four helix bundle protein
LNRDNGYSYRNLDVWQKAHAMTLRIIGHVSSLPRTPVSEVVTRQIIRSSSSVGANIAEGGSAAETDNWLAVLADAKPMESAVEAELHHECSVLMGALTNRIRAFDSQLKAAKSKVGDEMVDYVPQSLEGSDA